MSITDAGHRRTVAATARAPWRRVDTPPSSDL